MSDLAVLATVLILSAAPAFCADDVATVIAAHYPAELMSEEIPEIQTRFWDYKAIDLDGDSSTSEMVVLYSNLSEGQLCVLRTDAAATERLCAAEDLHGSRASLEVMDLESDGRPEFSATLHSFGDGGAFSWLFRWREGWETLTAEGEPLRDPLFFDFDGDGDLDALNGAEYRAETQLIHFWQGQGFEPGEWRVVQWTSLHRKEGPPTTKEYEVSLGEGEHDYRIRVAFDNGVTSATVSMNGSAIFAPHHFRPGVRALVSPTMTLTEPAQLRIELQGKPGGELYVIVESPPS